MGRQILVLLCVCLIISKVSGQTTLSYAHWLTQNEGLLESTNAFIYKDRSGFVWISSLDGLQRYDGREVKYFRTDPLNSKSVYGNNIQSPFFENKQGDIWFVTEDAINCYRRKKGYFEHYFINREAIPNSREQYYAFHLEQDRFLWVRADDNLYRFDTDHPDDSTKTQALHPFLGIRCAVVCRQDGTVKRVYGCFWDLKSGLELIDYNTEYQVTKRRELFVGTEKLAINVRQALPENDSLTWLATNYGLMALTVGNKTNFDIYPLYRNDQEGVRELLQLTNQQIIILSQGKGEVKVFNKNSKKYSKPLAVNYSLNGRPNQKIKSIYLNEKEFWGSAYGQGVFFCNLQPEIITHPFVKNQIESGKINKIIINNPNVYCLSNTGEVYVFSKQLGLVDRFELPHDARLFQDNQGLIWCHSNQGFSQLSVYTHQLKAYFPPNHNLFVYAICNKEPNSLFLACNSELLTINKNTPGKYTRYKLPTIWQLHQDKEGNTWAGTSTQLILFKQLGNQAPRILKTFATGFVTGILSTPKDSNLWVATLTGLRKFNRFTLQEDKYTSFPPELHHAVQAMVFDHQGTLWLGGNRGLFTYHPITGALRHFTQRDGLQSSEFYPGSIQVDALGNIWAGGNNGLDVINPDILQQRAEPPRLAITGLKIYDKKWQGATAIEETHQIRLPYDQNTLKFELAAMEYTDPARNQFKVFLKNHDRQWSNLSTQNFITYANLPPGKYQFMFTASNAQGIWQKQVKKLDIFITPPYWRTWWFTTLIILAVSTLIYAFFQYREQQRKKQERMRQQIARDLHDDVGSTLSSISILSESFLHSVEADLDKIRFSNIGEKARIALENISDIVWSVNPENDSMEKLLAKMSAFAFEMLENVGTELLFQVGENMGSIALPIEKRKDFYLIFKEAIHNCAKYAQAKHVEMRLEVKNNTLHMSIKDDGIGFDPDKIENPGMGGNGLKNMQRRTAAIGGTFSIQSNPGDGVTLHLAVPLVT
jgi:signal transduction histidine kinase/ligand-binding sensor domain-containing protein